MNQRQAACGAKLPPAGSVVYCAPEEQNDVQATLDVTHGEGVYTALAMAAAPMHGYTSNTDAAHIVRARQKS